MTTGTPSIALDCLEGVLRQILACGMALTDDVLHFMAATFGEATAAGLQSLLADPSSAERDSLLDLVFFPDRSLQCAIEPVLVHHPLPASDVDLLAARLKETPVVTRLLFPGTDHSVPVAMPDFVVDGFLARLNLAWQPVAALDAALSGFDTRGLSTTGGDADDGLFLRVLLRNADVKQTPVQVRFLCDFLERVPSESEDFVDKLAFVLVFMNEHEDAANLYQALMDRKKFIFQNLLKARRSADLAGRSNMETLIMTGVRTPYFDIDAAEHTLALIDSIAVAVYGRTEWLGGVPHEVDLGNTDDGLNPADLVRRLS
jgi:hypothetical protein